MEQSSRCLLRWFFSKYWLCWQNMSKYWTSWNKNKPALFLVVSIVVVVAQKQSLTLEVNDIWWVHKNGSTCNIIGCRAFCAHLSFNTMCKDRKKFSSWHIEIPWACATPCLAPLQCQMCRLQLASVQTSHSSAFSWWSCHIASSSSHLVCVADDLPSPPACLWANSALSGCLFCILQHPF